MSNWMEKLDLQWNGWVNTDGKKIANEWGPHSDIITFENIRYVK